MHLSPTQVLAVLKASRNRSNRDWAMTLLGFRHGMRCSELCNLKMADIDLRNASIVIRRLKGSLQSTQPLCGHRGQPLLDEPLALRAWLRDRGDDGSDYVFTSQKGGRMNRSTYFRAFQTIAEDASLPMDARHPHVLKHSLASILVAENANLAVVKTALGHKSISSTMQYVGVNERQAASVTQAALMAAF